jgi:hypothetical protein
MIKLKENPFPLVLNRGSSVSVLQALKLVDRIETAMGVRNLLQLISLQNTDGGFPNNLEPDSPSSIKITYRAIRTLTQIGVSEHSRIVMSAVNWLLNQQENDGGWHENPAIAIPKQVTWESTIKGVTWYTCQIAKLLKELEMRETLAFQKALLFLEKTELPNGGWPPVDGSKELDPDSTVGIGNFLATIHGDSYPSFMRAKKIFEGRLTELVEKLENETIDDAYELTHLVFSETPNHMYTLGDERVRKVLETLIEAQHEDGGWKTFYSGGKSDVGITVYALQLLVSHRIIKKETLQEMFEDAIK